MTDGPDVGWPVLDIKDHWPDSKQAQTFFFTTHSKKYDEGADTFPLDDDKYDTPALHRTVTGHYLSFRLTLESHRALQHGISDTA